MVVFVLFVFHPNNSKTSCVKTIWTPPGSTVHQFEVSKLERRDYCIVLVAPLLVSVFDTEVMCCCVYVFSGPFDDDWRCVSLLSPSEGRVPFARVLPAFPRIFATTYGWHLQSPTTPQFWLYREKHQCLMRGVVLPAHEPFGCNTPERDLPVLSSAILPAFCRVLLVSHRRHASRTGSHPFRVPISYLYCSVFCFIIVVAHHSGYFQMQTIILK